MQFVISFETFNCTNVPSKFGQNKKIKNVPSKLPLSCKKMAKIQLVKK
jgi:hypothetical protein